MAAGLNEMYNEIHKPLSHAFPIQNSLKQGRCFIVSAFKFCFRLCYLEGTGKPGGAKIKWDTSPACLF
jgi:hypothetical protein